MRHFFRAAQENQLFFLFYDRKKIGSVNNIRESETDEYNNKNILVKKTKRTKTEWTKKKFNKRTSCINVTKPTDWTSFKKRQAANIHTTVLRSVFRCFLLLVFFRWTLFFFLRSYFSSFSFAFRSFKYVWSQIHTYRNYRTKHIQQTAQYSNGAR